MSTEQLVSPPAAPLSSHADAALFCREILPAVSRTFALNIAVLPPPLDLAATLAYLLCRIADTVEDESNGTVPERKALFTELSRLTQLPADWPGAAERFAAAAAASLRPEVSPSEMALVLETPKVLHAFAGLPSATHAPIARAVGAMTRGMGEVLERSRTRRQPGLQNLGETFEYCYYVAGTLLEMVTTLFVWHAPSPSLWEAREEMKSRAVALGRALQLTSILRDIREDLERGDCWLPLDLLARHGLTPKTLLQPGMRLQALAALDELIGVTHGEAIQAFEYVLALPGEERGMRQFCLWPIFMALLTLKKLQGNPAVFETTKVRIDHSTVAAVGELTGAFVSNDRVLRFLFNALTDGLPTPPSP